MKTRLCTFGLAAILATGLAACDSGSDSDSTPLDLELERLRNATAAFADFDAAVAAGYSVEVIDPGTGSSTFPGMGIHYLNPDLLDDQFELERPEILLFVRNDQGAMELVAVEYATPIADLQNPPPAPQGFTGDRDAWAVNQTFSLWTLHAWVWMDNPDGTFASHNPRLH